MGSLPTAVLKNTGQTQHTTETSQTLLPTPTQVDWKGRGPNSKQTGIDQVIAHKMSQYSQVDSHQPFSHAGRRKGTADDRYKWPEMFAVIRNVRPDWVIAEKRSRTRFLERRHGSRNSVC